MDVDDINDLYHVLREVNLTKDIELRDAIGGLASHLTRLSGDYDGLLRYLNFYGTRFLLCEIVHSLNELHDLPFFSRVVDVGAGLGWLGRGLSFHFHTGSLLIDKRQFPGIDVVADIETVNGIERVKDMINEGDFIVMSEVIHCLDNPEEILRNFSKQPVLIIEYNNETDVYGESYVEQVSSCGCKVMSIHQIDAMLPKAFKPTSIYKKTIGNDAYVMWIIIPDDTEFNNTTGEEPEIKDDEKEEQKRWESPKIPNTKYRCQEQNRQRVSNKGCMYRTTVTEITVIQE